MSALFQDQSLPACINHQILMIYCNNHCKLCSYLPLTMLSFLTALSAVLIASGNDIPQGTFRVCFERRIPHFCLNCRVLFSILCAFSWGLLLLFVFRKFKYT